MKVYNLTDVKTPVLEQRGLVEQGIAIVGRIVNPGEYVDVEDSPRSRGDLEYLLQVGAVAIDQLPPPYVLARQQAEAAAGGRMRQHVSVAETKIAGEPPPSPPVEGETVTLGRADPGPPDPPADPLPEPPSAPAQPEDSPPNQAPPGAPSKKKPR